MGLVLGFAENSRLSGRRTVKGSYVGRCGRPHASIQCYTCERRARFQLLRHSQSEMTQVPHGTACSTTGSWLAWRRPFRAGGTKSDTTDRHHCSEGFCHPVYHPIQAIPLLPRSSALKAGSFHPLPRSPVTYPEREDCTCPHPPRPNHGSTHDGLG